MPVKMQKKFMMIVTNLFLHPIQLVLLESIQMFFLDGIKEVFQNMK